MENRASTTRITSDGPVARSHPSAVFLLVCALAVLVSATVASADLTLWGVDENDGELFSIDNYSTLSGFTSYGKLKYYQGTRLKNVGAHIEAFGLDPDGMAYMAVNDDLGDIDEPVFMKFNIGDATTSGPNVVTVVGRIGVTFDSSSDNITGLSYHPGTGELYALFRDNHDSTIDRLLIIDKDTGAVVSDLGTITGLGEKVQSGEDMTFDDRGNLYVTDNKDDHLYRVDPANAQIIDLVDSDMGRSVRFEALAWDHELGRMIGFDDYSDKFALLTLENGSNTFLGRVCGLGDVEGMDFVPVPEPATLTLLVLGGAAILARRQRRA